MSGQRSGSRPVPHEAPSDFSTGRSSTADSSRATSIARLASSPTPSNTALGTSVDRRTPTPRYTTGGHHTPLPGAEGFSSASGPGQSALAAALQGTAGRSPPRFGTPPRLGTPPIQPLASNADTRQWQGSGSQSTYGSLDTKLTQGLPAQSLFAPGENPEVVKRHLVQPTDNGSSDGRQATRPLGQDQNTSPLPYEERNNGSVGLGEEDFSSLRLQGGDVTRGVYRWAEDAESQSILGGRSKRSKSFHVSRPEPESEVLDIASIKIPGGFRRDYLRRTDAGPGHAKGGPAGVVQKGAGQAQNLRSRIATNNFIHFLTLYGHFAGEELEEIKEDDESDEYFSDAFDEGRYLESTQGERENEDPNESSALLTPGTPGRRHRRLRDRGHSGGNTTFGAGIMLLKSFVGTGVLFLPKAYLNGGMLFSNLVLLCVAALSYYCFILLVSTHLRVQGSFGDMGGILYGKWLRTLILSSVALSQIGFVSAYIVFTSENLQAFILAVSKCRTWIDIKFMVLMQLIIFLPLSLTRDISALSLTAYVADFFILLGLIYLYYFDISSLVYNHGVSDIINFNPTDWTLFIGTAIFTFEGVGLIIPIQESMKQPTKFPPILATVMIIITVVFISIGALSYAAFGSATETVVLLNLPQDNKFVNAVQFLYSFAILLSTPLQLFPAIRIMENGLFTRSGKDNPYIKWKKNVFRFLLVMACAMIAWGGAGDLDKFVALVGSFACVPLVYVYPALLHLKGVAETRNQQIIDIVICTFGVVGMVYTTTLTLQNWAGGSSTKSPGYCDK
ncbi:MAG: hypothetical protein Q9167_001368 [Letrouitia subvulpina]